MSLRLIAAGLVVAGVFASLLALTSAEVSVAAAQDSSLQPDHDSFGEPAVVNGRPVRPFEFPTLAGLALDRFDGSDQAFCGATLIGGLTWALVGSNTSEDDTPTVRLQLSPQGVLVGGRF